MSANPRPVGRATILGLVSGGVALALFAAARLAPGVVEAAYARGIYPWIAEGLARASAGVPFSLGEIALAAIPLLLAHGGLSGYRAARRAGRGTLRAVGLGGLRLAARAGTVWAIFLLAWGLQYGRPAAASIFGIRPLRDRGAGEAVVEAIGARLDALRRSIPEDGSGVASMPADWRALDAEVAALQGAVLREIGLPSIEAGRVKRFASSALLLRWGVSGMYGPFTGEPQVVLPAAPTQLPFTLAHERAHLSGFAPEDAASFVGLLTCWRSRDPRVRYSAWLALWLALGKGGEGRVDGVGRDLEAMAAFSRRYRGPEAPTLWRAYSGFLSAHGVRGGTRSYGRVAGLALGWIAERGMPPD